MLRPHTYYSPRTVVALPLHRRRRALPLLQPPLQRGSDPPGQHPAPERPGHRPLVDVQGLGRPLEAAVPHQLPQQRRQTQVVDILDAVALLEDRTSVFHVLTSLSRRFITPIAKRHCHAVFGHQPPVSAGLQTVTQDRVLPITERKEGFPKSASRVSDLHFGQVRGRPSCRGIHRCRHRHSYRGSISGVTTFGYTPYDDCYTELGAFRVSPRLPTLRMMIVIRSVVCEQCALSMCFVKETR